MKRFILFVAILACFAGCSLDEPMPAPGGGTAAVLKIGIGTPSRSSLFDSSKENTVSCFVLAAYRGGFLSTTEYYSAADGDFDASAQVSLPVSVNRGYAYNFYVLANFASMPLEGLFPAYEKDVPQMLLRPGSVPGGFIPMAGRGSLNAATGTIAVELTRLVAKIDCNITLPEGAVVEEARLCQVPAYSLPFGGGYAADADAVAAGDSFALNAGEGSGYAFAPAGVQGYTLTSEPLYVLENMQGSESGNSDPWRKYPSVAARASCATYINMKLRFPDGQVEMRFYLGADATGDYNLERGSCYTVNISVWDAQATRSGWSMVDLRYTDNWPGGDFLAGQVRSFSFRSPDVTLTPGAGCQGVIDLGGDGNGRWYVSALGAGTATINVIAENVVRGTIPITVCGWSGTANPLPLGLHGNAAGLFEYGVNVGGRVLYPSDLPAAQMPDDASLFCHEVLRTIIYGPDGDCMPLFDESGEIAYGVVNYCTGDDAFPGRPDSLFVNDPTDWESLYGAGRLFEHAFCLSTGDISLDIPVRINNALYTPARDSVKMVFHDWGLSTVRDGETATRTWRRPAGNLPVPPAGLTTIVSVPVTDPEDANGAVSYTYAKEDNGFCVRAAMGGSTDVSHTVGLVQVYADVTNSRSGTVYRTPLFKEENYLHLYCGAYRMIAATGMTGGQGKYNYEAARSAVCAELSADVHNLIKSNRAACNLYTTPGVVRYTDTDYILFPWGGNMDPNAWNYPYCFVARKQTGGTGSIGEILYWDYFWEYEHVDCTDAREYYELTGDPSLADEWAALELDTEKISQLYGGWLIVHKYEEFDGSTNGWVNEQGVVFPRNRHVEP